MVGLDLENCSPPVRDRIAACGILTSRPNATTLPKAVGKCPILAR